MQAIVDITEVMHLGGHRLRLVFADGVSGEVDFSDHDWTGVFEPLRDVAYFGQVSVDRELGTIAWPHGVDMAPEPLYDACRPRESR